MSSLPPLRSTKRIFRSVLSVQDSPSTAHRFAAAETFTQCAAAIRCGKKKPPATVREVSAKRFEVRIEAHDWN
jgi:hypothetical protein